MFGGGYGAAAAGNSDACKTHRIVEHLLLCRPEETAAVHIACSKNSEERLGLNAALVNNDIFVSFHEFCFLRRRTLHESFSTK